ncbi:MAG: hypothetical protein HY606_10930 [Planctomycetes bacterium]|nr:hypothetical protein [Planctomycetota bacterium]
MIQKSFIRTSLGLLIVFTICCLLSNCKKSSNNSNSDTNNNGNEQTQEIYPSVQLANPGDGEQELSLTPTFTWVESIPGLLPGSNATWIKKDRFMLKISGLTPLQGYVQSSVLVYENTNIAANANSFELPSGILSEGQTYYWSLDVVTEKKILSAGTRSFRTHRQASAPESERLTILYPANDTVDVPHGTELRWEFMSHRTPVNFTVRVWTIRFAPEVYTEIVSGTQYRTFIPRGLLYDNMVYFLMITATFPTGEPLRVSSRFFTVTGSNNGQPAAFYLTRIPDYPVGQQHNSIEWTRSLHAQRYRVEVSEANTFQSLVFSTELPAETTSYTIPRNSFRQGIIYYCRVLAVNDQGSAPAMHWIGVSDAVLYYSTFSIPIN